MFRVELQRAVRALTVYLGVVAATVIVSVAISYRSVIHERELHGWHANDPAPYSALIVGAAFITAILATILGTTLSRENGHLPLSWTRPQPRSRAAATLLAVDAAALLVAIIGTFALTFIPIAVFGMWSLLTMDADFGITFVVMCGWVLSWYALVQAASAWTTRGGVIAGLSWPAFILIVSAAGAPILPEPIRWIFNVLCAIDPMAYITHVDSSQGAVGLHGYFRLSPAGDAAALWTITLAAAAVAVTVWTRREAR